MIALVNLAHRATSSSASRAVFRACLIGSMLFGLGPSHALAEEGPTIEWVATPSDDDLMGAPAAAPPSPPLAPPEGEDTTALANASLALAEVELDTARRWSAARDLYILSVTLFGASAGTIALGAIFVSIGGVFDGDNPMVVGGGGVLAVGGLAFVGHVVTLVEAISLDVGAGHRRGNALAGSVSLRLAPGPGEIGAGLALDF